MNARFAAIPLALVLLAGCAAPEAESQPAESVRSTPTSTPTPSATVEKTEPAFQVSRQTTCNQLLGPDEDGPLFRTIDFVNEFQDIDPDTIAKARDLKAEVDGLAVHAEDDMKPFLKGFASPMTEMIDITGGGGSTYNFDATEFKAAGTELVNLCTPYFSASEELAEDPQALPQPLPISGVYEEDLAALGFFPDDISDYAPFMKANVCEGDTSDQTGSFRRNVRQLHDGDPALGSGAEILRLTVAYFCPERAGVLDEAIEEAIANFG
ncbi:hypothetical protein [Arthrobacter sp. CP30]